MNELQEKSITHTTNSCGPINVSLSLQQKNIAYTTRRRALHTIQEKSITHNHYIELTYQKSYQTVCSQRCHQIWTWFPAVRSTNFGHKPACTEMLWEIITYLYRWNWPSLTFSYYSLHLTFLLSSPVSQCVAWRAPICSNVYGGWFAPRARHSVRMTYWPSAALRLLRES